MQIKGLLLFIFIVCSSYAPVAQGLEGLRQPNTLPQNKQVISTAQPKKDTLSKPPKHSPKKAATRSAILPGWGQAYNKSYWKIPIVYAALGITGAVLIDNIKTYNDINYALGLLAKKDTANYGTVDNALKPFMYSQYGENSLINYRGEYRRNIDYSVLILILFWGLNVVEATVDAHLKSFDVSNDLSMKIKPNILPMGNGLGMSVVFDLHKGKPRVWTVPR